MSNLVACPDNGERFDSPMWYKPWVFMAGGISNCPNWQKDYIDALDENNDMILVNPRRDDFDITDPNASSFQIEWEHKMLEKCQVITFWFPEETLCPITLFELGKYSRSNKHIIIGTHPNYGRRFDVVKQMSLVAPYIKVHDNLDDVLTELEGVVSRWRL